jgi:hypothetical protein
MTAAMVLDGPISGPAFLPYVEPMLAPTLKRGDAVIMDNLPAHRLVGVHVAIAPSDAGLRMLSPC